MELLKGVIKKSIIILVPAAIASVFLKQERLPLGILIGGLFGLLNLRGLARSVSGLIGTEKAAAKIVFLNMIRLLLLFSAIFILVYFKIVNVFGLLFGFTVVFVLILVEGIKTH